MNKILLKVLLVAVLSTVIISPSTWSAVLCVNPGGIGGCYDSIQGAVDAVGAIDSAMQSGGDRLADLQNNDGGWDWPLDDGNKASGSAPNTVGPIAMGLAQAYLRTGDPVHLTALQQAGAFLLAKTNNFSPSDGYLAAKLDQVFGVTTYTDHVTTYFYDELAAGTYNRLGLGVLYSTATYVQLIRTSRSGDYANLAAWDIGMGLVGAASVGASTAEWIAGVKAEINELNGDGWYDVIGLAGAVYGLAFVGEDFDPTAGEHAAASSLSDLAAILASYQIDGGGFTWNSNYVIPNDGNEVIQETAYAILALNEFDRDGYLNEIRGAANYIRSVQLVTGGWENYTGSGENNEITGEALWGHSIVYPAGASIINVAAGVYNENQITINKALTINGAGASSTIIDGGGTTLTTAGLVRIIADGNVTFTGFTVQNAGGSLIPGGDFGDGKLNVGIYAQSDSAGVTYLISGNKILGTNNPDDEEDYGFYSNSGEENLIFTNNEITQTGANAVLIEKHPGATEISYNTLDAGCFGIDSIFYMTYGGEDITTLQKVSYNTIDIGTGTNAGDYNATAISFMSSYSGSGELGDGKYTNIEISYNTISDLGIKRRGISLYNDADLGGTGGEISNSLIKGNILTGITGTSPNFGIRLAGLVTDTTILYNQIIDCDMSFLGIDARNSLGVYPTSTLINYNNFENNASGLVWNGTTVLNAEFNWWGDASGPLDPNGANETDGKYCYNPSTMKNADGAGDDVTDLTVDYCPWLPPIYTDYDEDGILDNEDNCPITPNPDQLDTRPPGGNQPHSIGDACECESDLDRSGAVDGVDTNLYKADYGRNPYHPRPCTNEDPCLGDFDCSGAVDGVDTNLYKSDYGRNPYNNPCPDHSGYICVYP